MNSALAKVTGPGDPAATVEAFIAGTGTPVVQTQRQWQAVIGEAATQIRELRKQSGASAKAADPRTPAGRLEAFIAGSERGPGLLTQKTASAIMSTAASEIMELREALGKKPAATAPAKTEAKPAPAPGPAAKASPAAKVITRSQFDALSHPERNEYIRQGGKVIDNPATAKAATVGTMTAEQFRQSIAPPTMTRAEFEKLSHLEKNAYMRSGGKLVA